MKLAILTGLMVAAMASSAMATQFALLVCFTLAPPQVLTEFTCGDCLPSFQQEIQGSWPIGQNLGPYYGQIAFTYWTALPQDERKQAIIDSLLRLCPTKPTS